ncbi:hypothetical protein R1flu_012715 [Riccia fluitans]|uniref:Uncharacterized protein n=1 Tax=Riccia fluitans TaxID=41844 RepID=A0ABD1ZBN2_9MARC
MIAGEHSVALTTGGGYLRTCSIAKFNEDDGRRAFSFFDSWADTSECAPLRILMRMMAGEHSVAFDCWADTSERAPMLKTDLWLNFEGHGLPEQGNKKKGSDVKGWAIPSNYSVKLLDIGMPAEGAAVAERQEELEGDASSTVAAAAEGGYGPGWGQKRILS